MNKTRIIHTGLYGEHAYEVFDSVHGQLSDGKWENSPGYDKYWLNFKVETADDGEVVFKVNAEGSTMWGQRWLSNPFYNMPEADFKKWIARKIKAVVNDEREDRMGFGSWDRRNTDHHTAYLGKYDSALRDIVTTVADVYCTYEALLGREINAAKYDSSTICHVCGTKRTAEEIAKVKSANAIKARYAAMRAELQRAKNEAVSKLEKELNDNIVKLSEEERNELASLSNTVARQF